MNKSKRLLQLVSLVLLGSLELGISQLVYNSRDGIIIITGYNGLDETVVIPDTIDNLPVVAIARRAFFNQEHLRAVSLPSSLTRIEDEAFAACTNLVRMDLPDSVTATGRSVFSGCSLLSQVSIGRNLANLGFRSFAGCRSLTWIDVHPLNEHFISVEGVVFLREPNILVAYPPGRVGHYTVPDNVIDLRYSAFSDCPGLTSVALPQSLTRLAYSDFAGCTGLTNVIFGSKFVEIGRNVFSKCTSLIQLNLPDSLTDIGPSAFSGCTNLSTMTLPDRVSVLQTQTFEDCTKLSEVNFGRGLRTIENQAFERCTGLVQFTVPNHVTRLENFVFRGCSNLTFALIGSGVAHIGVGTFVDCSNLQAIDVDDLNLYYKGIEGVLYNKNGSELLAYPGGRTGGYVVPRSVREISYEVFADHAYLSSIVLEDRPSFNRRLNFSDCQSLTNVVIGEGVTSIDYLAFYRCTNLITVYLGQSVTQIQANAFAGCPNLTKVYFAGNTPIIFNGPTHELYSSSPAAINYYLPETIGWTASFGNRPTALWRPRILIQDAVINREEDWIEFAIGWANQRTVMVDASSNLNAQTWFPVATNRMTNHISVFRDPFRISEKPRFYRLRGF